MLLESGPSIFQTCICTHRTGNEVCHTDSHWFRRGVTPWHSLQESTHCGSCSAAVHLRAVSLECADVLTAS